jgi:hypothetical protein
MQTFPNPTRKIKVEWLRTDTVDKQNVASCDVEVDMPGPMQTAQPPPNRVYNVLDNASLLIRPPTGKNLFHQPAGKYQDLNHVHPQWPNTLLGVLVDADGKHMSRGSIEQTKSITTQHVRDNDQYPT